MVDEPVLLTTSMPWGVRLTLNRPAKLNAIDHDLRVALVEAVEAATADDRVRVIVIEGAGRAFCSGYDLSEGQPPDTWAWRTALAEDVEATLTIWRCPKPVIAQVHGHCLAGGTELATACDLVYVADDAKIGYPVTRIVSPPDAQVFPWLVGMRHALEMMLTGDAITGTDAAKWGFATRAYPSAELESAVLAVAVCVCAATASVVNVCVCDPADPVEKSSAAPSVSVPAHCPIDCVPPPLPMSMLWLCEPAASLVPVWL